MQRRAGIVVLAAVDDTEASLQPRQPVLIPIDPAPAPRTAPAQVDVAESHAAEVGEVSDSRLRRGNRRIEGDRTDDDNKVFHLERKEKIEVNDTFGIEQPISEQDPINSRRGADARYHLIRH